MLKPQGTELSRSGGIYPGYVLALLTLLYTLNFLDRQIINILAESIKRDLAISDTELGLLTGTSFGIFYSLLGIPIARLADRWSRVGIISFSLFLWSLLTAASGLAQSYAQLFLMRLGVGVGEAGGSPPAQSLISDYFPYSRRATAMAVFTLGVPLGSFLGFLIGGIVDDLWGWRAAFLVAGVPGLVLVLLMRLTMKEPPRGMAEGIASPADTEILPLRATLRGLFARKSFIRLVLGGTFGILIVYITSAWLPPFFIRVHGMTAGEIGGWLALSVGVGGAIGSIGGGWLSDKLRGRGYARPEIAILTISTAMTCPLLLLTVLSRDLTVALFGLFALNVFAFVWIGPTSATIQRVSPIRSRALAVGIQLSVANIFSLSLGPPVVGYLSDIFAAQHGAESLRYALAIASFAAFGGTACYFSAGRHVLGDIEQADLGHEEARGRASAPVERPA
ncbi:MAG TPA: MFS transporter [Allosphingosinicella sp.]